MMTFLAPPSRCALALVASVKKPVDSTTTSAPTSPHFRLGRVALGEDLDGLVADLDAAVDDRDVGRVAAEDRVVLEQVGHRLRGRRGRWRRRSRCRAPAGLHGPEEVAADAAEAVDAHADGHCVLLVRRCRSGTNLADGPTAPRRSLGAQRRRRAARCGPTPAAPPAPARRPAGRRGRRATASACGGHARRRRPRRVSAAARRPAPESPVAGRRHPGRAGRAAAASAPPVPARAERTGLEPGGREGQPDLRRARRRG